MLDTTASDNGWKLGDTVPITFAQTGRQQFKVESIYEQSGFTELRDLDRRRTRQNYTDQFDFQVYVSAEGWRHAREHRRRSSR